MAKLPVSHTLSPTAQDSPWGNPEMTIVELGPLLNFIIVHQLSHEGATLCEPQDVFSWIVAVWSTPWTVT